MPPRAPIRQDPAVFIRIRDLITDESVVIEDILMSERTPDSSGGIIQNLSIDRRMNNGGTAGFTIKNRDKKYMFVPTVSPAPSTTTGQHLITARPQGEPIGSDRRASILYETGFFSDKQTRNSLGVVGPADVWDYSTEVEFFKELFTQNRDWTELNQERAILLQEIKSGVLSDSDIASHLSRIYRTTEITEFRAQIDVDMRDSRGFWYAAFTGFIKNVEDIQEAGQVPEIQVTCHDYMALMEWTQIPILSALKPREDTLTTQILKKLIPSQKPIALNNALSGRSDEEILDLLVKMTNASFSMEGALEAAREFQTPTYRQFRIDRMGSNLMVPSTVNGDAMQGEDFVSFERRTMPSQPRVGTTLPYFQRLDPNADPSLSFFDQFVKRGGRTAAFVPPPGGEGEGTFNFSALDERYFVSKKTSFIKNEIKGTIQHLQLEKFWDGPAMYFGTDERIDTAAVRNPKLFRAGMPYVRDELDGGTNEVIRESLRTNWNLFFNQVASPKDIMNNLLPRTLADFYVTGAGWLVYKNPRINSVPNIQFSPFEEPSLDALGSLVLVERLGGIEGQTPPELFHGSEYVMRDWTSRQYAKNETGRYTRVVVTGEVNLVDAFGVNEIRNAIAGLSLAPPHLVAALGERTLTATEVFRTSDKDALDQMSSTLMAYSNVAVNTAEFTYDKILPWEIGKTVYVPETDFIYYINSLRISYNHGMKVQTTLSCRSGHPRRMIVPVPWLLWAGSKGDATADLVANQGIASNLLIALGEVTGKVKGSPPLGQPSSKDFTAALYGTGITLSKLAMEAQGATVDGLKAIFAQQEQRKAKLQQQVEQRSPIAPPPASVTAPGSAKPGQIPTEMNAPQSVGPTAGTLSPNPIPGSPIPVSPVVITPPGG